MNLRHPFITTPRLAIFYALFWVVAASINVLILTFANGIDFPIAMLEVFSSILIFAVIGTAIWYVIKFSTIENSSWHQLVLTHAIAATIIVFIWIYSGMVVIKLLHPHPSVWLHKGMVNRIFGGYILYVIYVVFFYAVNYYQGFKEKLRNEGKLISLIKEAELHALKSQINPHFLFNSLNSISSLTMTDPERAQEMVINLSQLMRYSLKHDQKEKVTFKQELENNKLYLHIEKVRFGKKLNPIFEINEKCLNAEIPNMILQPLYENAIKYGVYEATEPVDIVTCCRCNEEVLEITIQNTYDPNVLNKKGEGIGLRNIRDRLQIIYGNPLLLKVKDNKKEFTVTLTIPQK
ncbi:MAG: histidine kinase [Prolixibacteraceae bacterium]|nr:histidine kinase [Prolixibacteraceae bacterium]